MLLVQKISMTIQIKLIKSYIILQELKKLVVLLMQLHWNRLHLKMELLRILLLLQIIILLLLLSTVKMYIEQEQQNHLHLWRKKLIVFGIIQILVLVATMPYGILWMVTAYVIAYFFWLFAWHCFAKQLCGIRLRDLLKDVIPYLLLTAFALGAGWWVSSFFSSIYVRFVVKVLVSAITYLLVLWQSGSVAFRESLNFLLIHRNQNRE